MHIQTTEMSCSPIRFHLEFGIFGPIQFRAQIHTSKHSVRDAKQPEDLLPCRPDINFGPSVRNLLRRRKFDG
jgi:hypothetical protein